MTIKIEIFYSDQTTVVIDGFDSTGLDSAVKTGVLAIVLWEPVNGKRIPLDYLEADNYTIGVNELANLIMAWGFDDNKTGWWHYGNPQGTDGYDKPVLPPMFYFYNSPDMKSWNFRGEQVNSAIWESTKAKRLAMQRRTRNV